MLISDLISRSREGFNENYRKEERDAQLIEAFRSGDKKAYDSLFYRYLPLVRKRSRDYFLAGADSDDLFQEGLIGLHKAIRDYRFTECDNFSGFADLCVTRQMISAIKRATRQKHRPLNSYVSLDGDRGVEEAKAINGIPMEGRPHADMEESILSEAQYQRIISGLLPRLSLFEREVLELRVGGMEYAEIARSLGTGFKSVDNALQRIKKKARPFLQSR